MATSSLESIFKDTLKCLGVLLKGQGFKRTGLKLYRTFESGNSIIIEFQKDKWNTDDEFNFKVNLGVSSAVLTTLLDGLLFFQVPKVPGVADCAVKDVLFPDAGSQEPWWVVTPNTVSAELAEQLRERLNLVLDNLIRLSDNNALCDFWLQGRGTGLSRLQRDKFLLALLSALGRHDELKEKAKELSEIHGETKLRELFSRLDLISL